MAAVHRFVEAFNSDTTELVQAACTDETSIIDDFPPYQWTGHRATARWHRDMFEVASEYGMSDWSVVSDEPRHLVVSHGLAYAVVPVAARWLEGGSPRDRTGAFTVALREDAEAWRISAFAWAWD